VDEIYLIIGDKEREYTVLSDGENYKFYYLGEAVSLYNTGVGITITYLQKSNVVCEFVTPFLNLDVPNKSKSLVSICVTPNLENGKINFGYRTKNTSHVSKISHYPSFDFENLDFKNFSLNSNFAEGYVLRTREPSFNYISFSFGSDTDADCSVINIYVTYKTNSNTMKGSI
jgi:hypothetical protein